MMKRHFIFLAVSLSSLSSFAQNRGGIYSPHGPGQVYFPGMRCSLRPDEVVCDAYDPSKIIYSSAAKNPQMATKGKSHFCFLDDNGVHCGGANTNGQSNVPTLDRPRMVLANKDYTCAIDNSGLKCWGRFPKALEVIPSLKNPQTVTARDDFSNDQLCAIDDTGVVCWGELDQEDSMYGPRPIRMPTLIKPKLISSGYSHTCVLDDEGVKCWGFDDKGQCKIPALKNPTSVYAKRNYTCALDDDGAKCWGEFSGSEIKEMEFPKFDYIYLDRLPQVFDFYIKSSTPARALYFSQIKAFIENNLSDVNPSDEINISRFFALTLASSAVLSGDSEYFYKSIIPTFNESLKNIGGYLRLDSYPDGYEYNVLDSRMNRLIALNSIKASLDVLKNFLTPPDVSIAENILRLIGQANANPMDDLKIKNIVTAIETLPLKEKTRLSTKSAFLVETLDTAAHWLQVKKTKSL